MAGQQGDFGVVAGDVAEGGQCLRFGFVVVGSRCGEEVAAEVVAGDCVFGGVGARRSFADGAWCVACGACGEAGGVGDCGGSGSGVG